MAVVTDNENFYHEMEKICIANPNYYQHLGVSHIDQYAADDNTMKGGNIERWLYIIKFWDHFCDCRLSKISNNVNDFYNYNRYMELKKWCEELESAREWFIQQINAKDQLIKELNNQINNSISNK